jgi:tetratricopeptide (TPR) repeat protein
LAYEKEKRQKGVYQGELEPLGKRGQEAEVAKNSPTVQDAPQLRSFTGPPDRKNFAGKQVDLVLPAPKEDESAQNTARRTTGREGVSPSPSTPPYASKQLPQRTRSPVMATPVSRTLSSRGRSRTSYSDDISDSSSQLSSSQLLQREYLPPVQLHTETGRTFRGDQPYPVDNNHSSSIPQAYRSPENDQDDDDDDEDDDDDDDSTQSDEELRQMQADLMPSMSKDIDIDQHVTPDSFSRPPSRNRSISTPSPVAASAAAAAATLQQDPSKQVERLNDEAMDAVQEGRFNDAVELFGQVLALQKSHYGSKHPTVASAYHNLGTVQAKRAATLTEDAVAQQLCRTAALEAFQSAARRARDSLGRSHPNVAVSLVRIGFLLLHSKQYTNSLITFAEALRIRLAAFGKHHALTANLYNNLGVCHMHMEQFDQGRRALHTGLEIQRKLCAESDATAKTNGTVPWLELADTLFNIGGLCLEWIRKQGPDLRRAQESEDSFAEAYEVSHEGESDRRQQ